MVIQSSILQKPNESDLFHLFIIKNGFSDFVFKINWDALFKILNTCFLDWVLLLIKNVAICEFATKNMWLLWTKHGFKIFSLTFSMCNSVFNIKSVYPMTYYTRKKISLLIHSLELPCIKILS